VSEFTRRGSLRLFTDLLSELRGSLCGGKWREDKE